MSRRPHTVSVARGWDDGGEGLEVVGRAALDVRLEVADGTARLQLSGPFTARTAGRVRAALALLSVAQARVVVDLVGVSQLDDAAEALLRSARRAARREGWELAVAGAGLPPASPALTGCP